MLFSVESGWRENQYVKIDVTDFLTKTDEVEKDLAKPQFSL